MKILITGGAGFIGSNLARHFSRDYTVAVFDSLERKGSEKNLAWLGASVEFIKGRITDKDLVENAASSTDIIFHLAAQVAVTNSIKNPRRDFEVNALGTFNVLEAARKLKKPPLIVYSSTNKVYGKISEDRLEEKATRYIDGNHPEGISENQPLDFCSPYGCSKGAAEAYARDYGRIYDLPTVVLRKSCIYGARQFGTEDQGWVAHFARKAINNEPITIYGNGKQIRDLLYIDDLVELYKRIIDGWKADSSKFRGEVYNVGGGRKNAVSLLELIGLLEKILDVKIIAEYKNWRPGDQKVYITNIGKAQKKLGWSIKIGVEQGLAKLIDWVYAI